MREWLIARAARLATAAGAELVVEPTPYLDPTDKDLNIIANALQTRAAETGIHLLALHREAQTLHVLLDDEAAEEPLSPGALQSTVRQLTWQLLGQVWDAHLHTPLPQPTHPAHFPAA